MDKPFYASIILLILAFLIKKYPSKEINKYFCYRTFQSMSSLQNWIYANKLAANFILITAILLFIVSIIGNWLQTEYVRYYYFILASGVLSMFFYIEYKLKFRLKKENII
ncbi:MAG: SdpI family protein [Bacteroidota bacterium]|jgi:uncharacterized membrane protein